MLQSTARKVYTQPATVTPNMASTSALGLDVSAVSVSVIGQCYSDFLCLNGFRRTYFLFSQIYSCCRFNRFIPAVCNVRGSFQKFCSLYVFSLKMNLFYKIHLQAFNVISIVLYHSGPTFEQVLYSCQDAFVVDVSDYLGHLIRHLLDASEAFPTEWSAQFWEQVEGWWAHVSTVRRVKKHLPSILFQKFPILHLRHEAAS